MELLEKIGLTKGESKVYLALLRIGKSNIGPIIKEAKVSNSKVYDILDRLAQKGLVGVAIEKVTYTSIQVGLIITITNPNLISVNIGEFRATAYANDVKISEIELSSQKLKPLETSEARFSLQVNFIDVGAALLKGI